MVQHEGSEPFQIYAVPVVDETGRQKPVKLNKEL